jgi:hypothetical protein
MVSAFLFVTLQAWLVVSLVSIALLFDDPFPTLDNFLPVVFFSGEHLLLLIDHHTHRGRIRGRRLRHHGHHRALAHGSASRCTDRHAHQCACRDCTIPAPCCSGPG